MMWITDIGPDCPKCGMTLYAYVEASDPDAKDIREQIWRKTRRHIGAEKGIIIAFCACCHHGMTFTAPREDTASLHIAELKDAHRRRLFSPA